MQNFIRFLQDNQAKFSKLKTLTLQLKTPPKTMTGQTAIAILRFSNIESFNLLTTLPFTIQEQVLTTTTINNFVNKTWRNSSNLKFTQMNNVFLNDIWSVDRISQDLNLHFTEGENFYKILHKNYLKGLKKLSRFC